MTSPGTTIATDGFAAHEVAEVVERVRNRYGRHLAPLSNINRLLTTAQYRMEAHQESAQDLTCAVLFVRTLAHCQATILLIERGMRPSARAMLRCSLEGLFNLGACASDYNAAIAFIDSHHVNRKRLGKKLAQVSSPHGRALRDQVDFDETMRTIDAEIAEVSARERQTKEMAQLAGLHDLYLTAYSLLSGAIHSTVGDLDQHLRPHPATGRLELHTAPELDNLDREMELLATVMVSLAHAMEKVFRLDIAAECERQRAVMPSTDAQTAG